MEPLEQRVKELEDRLAEYDRIFTRTASQLIINKPIVVKGTIAIGGPAGSSDNEGAMIFVGRGTPTFTAPQGSLFLRTNGGVGTTLYTNYNGGGGWDMMD